MYSGTDNWNEMTITDLKGHQAEINKIFSSQFKSLGLSKTGNTYTDAKIHNWMFVCETYLPTFSLTLVSTTFVETVYLHRFIFSPSIVPGSTHLRFPTPSWGYTFISLLVKQLTPTFLEEIETNGVRFQDMRALSRQFAIDLASKPLAVVTAKTLESEMNELANFSLGQLKDEIFPSL